MVEHDLTMSAEAIATRVLPSSLSTPTGWRSEIIQSNASASATSTDYHSTGYVNQYSTTKSSTPIPLARGSSSNQYENSSATNLSLEEQEIIRRVENQQEPPLVVRKQLPNNLVTYQQNISLRYLQPPTPPPPGPIIIREVRPPPPPAEPPIQIRQRPPPPTTPPPLVLRERPPPIPPRTPAEVVEKVLPAPPSAPRRVVVERFGSCPPKPADVVIERWLPYKEPPPRSVLLERAPSPPIASREPNLLILHESPQARIRKEFINQGVVREDPDYYLQRYGAELGSWQSTGRNGDLIDEASRVIPPPSGALAASRDRYYRDEQYSYYADRYRRAPSPYLSTGWDRTRVLSPLPRFSTYRDDYPYYDYPYYDYCRGSSYRDDYDYYRRPVYRDSYDSYRSYDDRPPHYGSYMTMADVTPSWNRYCGSSRSSYYPYASPYPPRTIRVRSEGEFRRVLSDLTDGRF